MSRCKGNGRELERNWFRGIEVIESFSHISTTWPTLRPWTEQSGFKDHPRGRWAVLCVLKTKRFNVEHAPTAFRPVLSFLQSRCSVRHIPVLHLPLSPRWVRHVHWASLLGSARHVCYSFTSSELTSGCVVGRWQRPDGNERIAGFSWVADVDNLRRCHRSDCARGRFVHSAANADNAHMLLNARSQVLNPGVPELSAMRAYNLAHNCPRSTAFERLQINYLNSHNSCLLYEFRWFYVSFLWRFAKKKYQIKSNQILPACLLTFESRYVAIENRKQIYTYRVKLERKMLIVRYKNS